MNNGEWTDGRTRLRPRRQPWRSWGIGALLIIVLLCLAGIGYIALGKWAWHAADGATIIGQWRSQFTATPLESRTVSVTNAAQARTLQHWLNETTISLSQSRSSINSTDNYYDDYTIRLTWHGILIEVASLDTRELVWRVRVLGWLSGGRITAPGNTPVLDELLAAYPQLPVPANAAR